MKKRLRNLKKLLGNLKLYGIITLGTFLAALGISVFLTPPGLVPGGISGIGIMIHSLTGFPVGIFMLLVNIPLFILGFWLLGAGFGAKSVFGTLTLSVFTDLLAFLPPVTEDLMLSAVIGGGLLGLGMGLVFLSGATTGGTDIVARLGHKLVRAIDVGKWLLIIDALIIFSAGLVFANWERCLYGVITVVINSLLVDVIIRGANFAKVVYVISPVAENIAAELMSSLSRGVTGIYVKGMYKNDEKLMLMCVIKNYEITKLERIVAKWDENAFIIFSGAREVSGEGFKIYPTN